MIRVVSAYLLLVSSAATAAPTTDIAMRVMALADTEYLGGIDSEGQAVAALAQSIIGARLGSALPVCDPEDKTLVPESMRQASASLARGEAGELFRALTLLLTDERQVVRDTAAFVASELGPSAISLTTALEASRSIWSEHALSRISCESPTFYHPLELIPDAMRAPLPNPARSAEDVAHHLAMIAELVNAPNLRWPDEFFTSWVWGFKVPNDTLENLNSLPLAETAIPAIVAVVADGERDVRLRLDLVEVLSALRSSAVVAQPLLVELARADDEALAEGAANALVAMGPAQVSLGLEVLFERGFWIDPEHFQTLCDLPADLVSERLLGALVEKLKLADDWTLALPVAEAMGCHQGPRIERALRTALGHANWEVQLGAARLLADHASLESDTTLALKSLAGDHWSGLVRESAHAVLLKNAVETALGDQSVPEPIADIEFGSCPDRCPKNHGNQHCGSERGINDGLYASPTLGEFAVQWRKARRRDAPKAFPIKTGGDFGSAYGSDSFLEVGNGWLHAADRWQSHGTLQFVDRVGRIQRIGDSESAAALVSTPDFGHVLLGSAEYGTGRPGLIAQISPGQTGWSLRYIASLPSRPWGWAFAPNGTLLVADPFNAVAVHADGRVESLSCPKRSAIAPDASLLRLSGLATIAPFPERYQTASARHNKYEDLLGYGPGHSAGYWDETQSAENVLGEAYFEAIDEFAHSLMQIGRSVDGYRAVSNAQRYKEQWRSAYIVPLAAAAGDRAILERALLRVRSGAAVGDEGLLFTMAALVRGEFERATQLAQSAGANLSEDGLKRLRLLRLISSEGEGSERLELSTQNGTRNWQESLAAFLRGHISETELAMLCVSAGDQIDREKLSEALFYQGLILRRQLRTALAEQHFAKVIDLGLADSAEYAAIQIAALQIANESDN